MKINSPSMETNSSQIRYSVLSFFWAFEGKRRFPKWTPVIEEPKDMATKKAAKKSTKKAPAKKAAKKK